MENNIYNQFISTKLQAFMEQQDTENIHKKKDSFWASESEKPLFDLYHQWIGTPPTNPIEAETLVVFSAGKLMETALVENLDKMGLIQKQPNNEQYHFRIVRKDVPISGYTDAIFTDGTPLEIKTFFGDYQARELAAGKPRTSYLKQLAIYCDALDQPMGKLIYMDRGTGKMYEFTLVRVSDVKFKCMNIEFDLDDTYTRWQNLMVNHLTPKIAPQSEFRYKIPIDQIDWPKISKSDVSKARNNQKVIGDSWQVAYSPYKNLIIEQEGTTLGYSDEEIAKIKELTKNYTKR